MKTARQTEYTVSFHAKVRYRQRTGKPDLSDVAAHNHLVALMENAVHLRGDQYYAKGWIIGMRDKTITTIFRPVTPAQQLAVYRLNAVRHRQASPPQAS